MAAESTSSHQCSTVPPAKAIVVRVKRKRLHDPVESLWVEVSARPAKRPELDLSSLSLHEGKVPVSREIVETRSTRLLFRHLETITSFGAEETSRVETLLKSAGDERPSGKLRERRNISTKKQDYHGAHLTTARVTHEALAKAARFEQVWRRRNTHLKDDTLAQLFHLYDVVRVDAEANVSDKHQKETQAKREPELADNQLLHNYLPLLKEFLPTAAAQLESESASYSAEEDEYVYDVYALEEGANGSEADETDYPLVHVVDDEDGRWGTSSDSNCDSEDSNDENNPRNDYPEEEDSESEIESNAEEGTSDLDSEIRDEDLFKDNMSEEYIDFSNEYGDNYDSADENE